MNNVKMMLVLAVGLLGCGAVEVVDRQAVLNAPFDGPGWDQKAKAPRDVTPRRVVVAVTHLMLPNKVAAHREFWDVFNPIKERLASQPGLIGYATRTSMDLSEDWTVSIWETEEAMYEYVVGTEHADAITRMEKWATGAWVAHFEADITDLPDMDDVPALVRQHGRKAYNHVPDQAE